MALLEFPGLINAHVHLRDPGATQKEDFKTGSKAALRGGFTVVIDMPNNPLPTVSMARLEEKKRLVKEKAACFVGFYYGTDGANLDSFYEAAHDPFVFGLKIYCNHTTGSLLIEDETVIANIMSAWKSVKPILVHAEGETLEKILFILRKNPRPLHMCHVSTAIETELVRKAKSEHLPITAGVTPHHLFLTANDVEKLGPFARMKPELATKKDQDAIWEALISGTIDIVESDHAPHTKAEKESSTPPYGVPNIEETFGLLIRAVHEKRLAMDQVRRFLHDEPKRIFRIPFDTGRIWFDPNEPYIVGSDGWETKCGWSPFTGWEIYGRVKKVEVKK